MKSRPEVRAVVVLTLAVCLSAVTAWPGEALGEEGWQQWGGPRHDFQSAVHGLATHWGRGGPRLLWERPLGDGYSGIVTDGRRLYTMYHQGDHEVAVALDAATGKTVWEKRYAASPSENMDLEYGPGPHATPALAGDRLFTVGTTLLVHAFDSASGEVLWSRDLVEELGLTLQRRGFGASPLVYGDLLILTPGGDGTGVVAYRQDDGSPAWKSQSFRASYSSPILARVGGEDQIIVAMGPDRAGLDPTTGQLEWRLTLRGESSNIMSTQLWDEDGSILFGSAAYTDGSRAIRVERRDGRFVAEELWFNTQMRVQHGTMVRLGKRVYGSSGDFGITMLTAIDVETGELAFRQRGFSKANLFAADGKILILDEDGLLAVGTPGENGIEIHDQARILESPSWTVPTLSGTHLFVRDRQRVKAFDLGLE